MAPYYPELNTNEAFLVHNNSFLKRFAFVSILSRRIFLEKTISTQEKASHVIKVSAIFLLHLVSHRQICWFSSVRNTHIMTTLLEIYAIWDQETLPITNIILLIESFSHKILLIHLKAHTHTFSFQEPMFLTKESI